MKEIVEMHPCSPSSNFDETVECGICLAVADGSLGGYVGNKDIEADACSPFSDNFFIVLFLSDIIHCFIFS